MCLEGKFKMIKVFHKKNNASSIISLDDLCKELISKYLLSSVLENYDLVALVYTDELDIAKNKTTHIKVNWWDNDNVDSDEEIGLLVNARSTAVGDVLLTLKGAFEVVKDGYKSIPEFPISFFDLELGKIDFGKVAI